MNYKVGDMFIIKNSKHDILDVVFVIKEYDSLVRLFFTKSKHVDLRYKYGIKNEIFKNRWKHYAV